MPGLWEVTAAVQLPVCTGQAYVSDRRIGVGTAVAKAAAATSASSSRNSSSSSSSSSSRTRSSTRNSSRVGVERVDVRSIGEKGFGTW